MVIKICKSKEQIGKCAAAIYAAQVLKKPDSVLGFATGSSVLTAYAGIIEAFEAGTADFGRVTTFNLDEYCGLDAKHSQSYNYFMRENLFKRINVPEENINIPDGAAEDYDAYCAGYEAAIEKAGGIDLQLLGIGREGHIAFNEAGEIFKKSTHTITLAESTIEANARFFSSADEVPKKALTMGIGTIMKARSIVLLADGEAKAEAVKNMIKGEITPSCPASVLQLHGDVTVVLDEAAARLISD